MGGNRDSDSSDSEPISCKAVGCKTKTKKLKDAKTVHRVLTLRLILFHCLFKDTELCIFNKVDLLKVTLY